MKKKLTRRSFGAIVGAGAALPTLAQEATQFQPVQQQQQRRGPRAEVQPFDGPIEFARRQAESKVEPFPLLRVRLTASIFKDAEDWNRGYMSRLAPDRLLYNFRENAGLAT